MSLEAQPRTATSNRMLAAGLCDRADVHTRRAATGDIVEAALHHQQAARLKAMAQGVLVARAIRQEMETARSIADAVQARAG